MFVSTSSASFLLHREKIYNNVRENLMFKKVVVNFFQLVTNIEENKIRNANGNTNDDETTDADDADEGDENYDIDEPETPEEDVLLPKEWNLVGEKTPDDGDEPVIEENDLEDNPTIDIDGPEGTTLQEESTIDINGEEGTTNEVIIVEDGDTETIFEPEVEVVVSYNGNVGTFLKRVIETTVSTDGTSSDSGGSAENIKSEVVVVTAGDE